MRIAVALLCCSALAALPRAGGSCPSQCSCSFHSLSEGTKARTVLCNDPEMTLPPVNIPIDTTKLRIEKTAIRRVPGEAFHLLHNLEYLWMSYNSLASLSGTPFKGLRRLQELRLDGNNLISFPWESLAGMPQLRLLDLHNNELTSIPPDAARYVKNITYLDLSSNKLMTLPQALIATWANLQAVPYFPNDNSKIILELEFNRCKLGEQNCSNHARAWLRRQDGKSAKCLLRSEYSLNTSTQQDITSYKQERCSPQCPPITWDSAQTLPIMVTGLQDNPWVCDCSLYEMVHFLNFQSPNIAFIEPRLKCFTPRSLAGVFFSQVELRKCQSPVVHTSVAKVKTILGSTVLLRCGTTGVPIPELSWRRADGAQLNGTVHQEISSDGMSWSILGLPVVSYLDSGEYICKAKNFLGATEAFISLIITDSESTDDPNSNGKGTWNGKASGMQAAAYNDELVARYVITTSTVPTLGAGVGTGDGLLLPDMAQDSNPQNLLVSSTMGQKEPERMVRSVRVIGDTDQGITLAWKAPLAKNTTVFSVLYAVFGERDMRRINVEPGKTKVTVYGLLPKTKYIVCVCVKGLIPRKEQCIIFSTDEVFSAGGTQKLINVVVISVACVIAVPLTLVVCCGALKRRCKKCFVRKPKEIQESYVTFESLSPGAKAKGVEGEYLTRHTPDESNRLLSARSSMDSEAIPKIEGQPNEYFC